MNPALNPSSSTGTAGAEIKLTSEQVATYRNLVCDGNARKAATIALAAIQYFAKQLNAADLLRGSVVHGADWETWLAELTKEATLNAETVKRYRSSFEDARKAACAELYAADSAALELLGRRRDAAAMAESQAKSTKLDWQSMHTKLTDAGLTPGEVSDHMSQRFSGGFEELEAGLLLRRDAHLAEVQALETYLSDPERQTSPLPEPLRQELQDLAQHAPLRAAATNHMAVAAQRSW